MNEPQSDEESGTDEDGDDDLAPIEPEEQEDEPWAT
jgi:hypothetical protein